MTGCAFSLRVLMMAAGIPVRDYVCREFIFASRRFVEDQEIVGFKEKAGAREQ